MRAAFRVTPNQCCTAYLSCHVFSCDRGWRVRRARPVGRRLLDRWRCRYYRIPYAPRGARSTWSPRSPLSYTHSHLSAVPSVEVAARILDCVTLQVPVLSTTVADATRPTSPITMEPGAAAEPPAAAAAPPPPDEPAVGDVVVILPSGAEGGRMPLFDEVTMGREGDCDIRIRIPAVSRQHARLHFDGRKVRPRTGRGSEIRAACSLVGTHSQARLRFAAPPLPRPQVVWLTNLSKSNPTVLQGKPLATSRPLAHGDTFSILGRSFRWEYSECAPWRLGGGHASRSSGGHRGLSACIHLTSRGSSLRCSHGAQTTASAPTRQTSGQRRRPWSLPPSSRHSRRRLPRRRRRRLPRRPSPASSVCVPPLPPPRRRPSR